MSMLPPQRILICGIPKAGKTTHARKLAEDLPGDYTVLHTDDLIETESWSDVSRIVATEWMVRRGPWIIEGVAAVRALRKFIRHYPGTKPADLVLWMGTPRAQLTPGQLSMAKGCCSIWKSIPSEVLGTLNVHAY